MSLTLKYEVAVYLKGDGLDPDYATSELGVRPTRSHKKGESWKTTSGNEVVEKTGLWVLAVQGTGDVSAGLDQLLTLIGGNQSMPVFSGVDEAFLDVFVAIEPDHCGIGSSEFEMDARLIATIGNSRLPVRFTVAIVQE